MCLHVQCTSALCHSLFFFHNLVRCLLHTACSCFDFLSSTSSPSPIPPPPLNSSLLRLDAVRKLANKVGRSTAYDGHCRHLSASTEAERLAKGDRFVVRLKVPHEPGAVTATEVTDANYGTVSFDNSFIDDQVRVQSVECAFIPPPLSPFLPFSLPSFLPCLLPTHGHANTADSHRCC